MKSTLLHLDAPFDPKAEYVVSIELGHTLATTTAGRLESLRDLLEIHWACLPWWKRLIYNKREWERDMSLQILKVER